MRWLGVMTLAALSGCTLEVVHGTSEFSGRTGTTGGPTSGGVASGAATAGTTGGSAATGGSSTGGGVNGGSSSGGSANGGSSTGGDCGTGCPAGTTCVDGTCECPMRQTYCTDSTIAGESQGCFDTSSDPLNCGSCGFTCSGLGAQCSGGACRCAPGPAPSLCARATGALCTNVLGDTSNCGRCGNVCSTPALDCFNGLCECPGSMSLCGGLDSGVAPFCDDTTQDANNCGECDNVCDTSYAAGSGCRFGFCLCSPSQAYLCADIPSSSPPTCTCVSNDTNCTAPSFATDVYPLLAQQSGALGCSASGCHTGDMPAGGLGFLDAAGEMDAGMAYAELVGVDGGGSSEGVPYCDGGVPAGAPSTQCACVSRVVPGNIYASVLLDLLEDDVPGQCANTPPMPIDDTGGWSPLSSCSQQLIQQWVSTGANP